MKNLVTLSSEIENPYSDSSDQAEPLSFTGLETFSLCYKYAAAVQWLIPSVYIPKAHTEIDGSFELDKLKQRRSRHKLQASNLTADNTAIAESVMNFEKEFDAELQSLGPILSTSSQSEPYLTHLAQCILGAGNEKRV